MSDSYRVPKRPVNVQLRTAQFGFESVTVFLGERTETHAGPEAPIDLFNSQHAFLPVILDGGGTRFIALAQVVSVTLPPVIPDEAAPFYGTVVKVAVLMADGNALEGGFSYELPDAHQRLQDYLNEPVRFVQLHTPEGEVLLNKQYISHVSVN